MATINRLIKAVMILFIKAYQSIISPWLMPRCRFYPSCSHYMLDAFKQHHWFKASCLTVYRLLRCQPFSRGGYDPVPSSTQPTNRTCYHD